MSLFEVERLTRENKKFQQTMKDLRSQIHTLQNDCQTFRQVVKKDGNQKNALKLEIKDLKRRIQQMKYQKQETDGRYLKVLEKLENQIEDRKKKYHSLENRISPLLDHDTVRLKILNEVEGVHFMQLQEEKRKVGNLKDENLKLRRGIELVKHELNSQKMQHEEDVRKVKLWAEQTRNSDHFNALSFEMCTEIENKLRLNLEEAKKESQYYKDKYFNSQKKNQNRIFNLEKQLSLLKERHIISS